MKKNLRPLLLGTASCLCLASSALAGDFTVRVEAFVSDIDGSGSSIAPFSGAQVGDTMVVDYSVSYPGLADPEVFVINGASIPGIKYEIDYTNSRLEFQGQQISLEDTVPPPLVDGVTMSSEVNGILGYTGAGGGFLSITCWDFLNPAGSLLPSSDLAAAVGTSYDPSASYFFSPWLFYSDDPGVNADGLALIVTEVTVIQESASLGATYCSANVSSEDRSARIMASGSSVASDNDMTLTAINMPPMQFGFFLASETQGQTPVGAGTLCLGGSIVRFDGPGQIQQADANGKFALRVDTLALPAGTPTAIMPGDTWNFTTWYRDVDPATGATSNFTDAVSVTFE